MLLYNMLQFKKYVIFGRNLSLGGERLMSFLEISAEFSYI